MPELSKARMLAVQAFFCKKVEKYLGSIRLFLMKNRTQNS